ncbi:MAG: hypothetical protein IJW86_03955 [Clostridia bacterium]|nr:hypothetical protein [Clostridia bacterium]
MANHRPKSLSELNQVYDKAMQAQRAIKAGSKSLSDEAPQAQAPSQNIFDELKQQASQAKKPELYDSQIADIANDFLKRYAKPEQPKAKAAPKELKRPAPSIQSLYHTPVKAEEDEKSDVPLSLTQPDLAVAAEPAVTVTRPKALENIEASAPVQKAEVPAEIPQEETIEAVQEEPADFSITEQQQRRAATEQAQHEVYSAPAKAEVTPSVRITSTARNDLINEYLRVMSDDDSYYDDDEDYQKPKKSRFWSKLKKRRQEPVAEVLSEETSDSEETEPTTDIYSDYTEAEAAAPSDEAQQSEEAAPLSLYDYIEADFDFGEDGEIAEETHVDISGEETTDTIQAEPEDGTYSTEPDEGTYPTEPEEDTYPTEPEEGAYPTEPDEGTYPTEHGEDVVYPTEPEEDVIYPTEDEEEIIYPAEGEPQEESPTAGMVFDDIFSVTDESKRSYTGGNWSGDFESETEDETASQDDSAEYSEAVTEEVYARSYDEKHVPTPKKKKGAVISKIFLSLALVILVACTGLVTVLGNVIAVDTGKLFGDKYRAFSAEQSFSLSGVDAGDLVITEDYDSYAAEGDSFVYVSHESHKFMIGKHSGSTYNLTGDVLFIAENEAGRILVLREDTLGAIVRTYKGLGTILAPVSDNYIIIDAVLLLLILAVLLCLIVPKIKKSDKDTEPYYEAEDSDSDGDSQHYSQEDETDEPEDYSDEEPDSYDYDTDDIEEGLFSGI